MLLSNLKKWSKAIPTVSNFINNGSANNFSKTLTTFALKPDFNLFQTKSLYFARSECFSIFKKVQRGPSLSHKGKSKWNNLKRRSRHRSIAYKLPNHNGMVARVKIVIFSYLFFSKTD